MKLTYHGHACFIVESKGHSIIIDPFLNGNPLATIRPEDVKVDAILVSHGHKGHLGDAVFISKNCNVPIITSHALASYCESKGATGIAVNIGVSREFPFGIITLTPAFHGSPANSDTVGSPCGFLLTMEGKTLYHAGDTRLFYDMKQIGAAHKIDVALIPIGDSSAMGIHDAVKAVEFLKPRIAVPMHYNTWDVIRQDPRKFVDGLKEGATRGFIIKSGESIEIET